MYVQNIEIYPKSTQNNKLEFINEEDDKDSKKNDDNDENNEDNITQ